MPTSSKWEAEGATIPSRRCGQHGACGLNDAGNWGGSLNPKSGLCPNPHTFPSLTPGTLRACLSPRPEQTSLGVSWSCWADLGSTVPHGDDPVMSQGA